MTEERFILEVTTDYKPVLRNIKKYESFMNYLFAKDKNPMMALETLANGVLYFFESMKSFRGFIDKVVKGLKSLENPSCFHKKSIFLNFFLHRVIKKKKFPEKGVEFNAEMIGNPDQVKDFIEKYNEKYSKYLISLIHKDLRVKLIPPNHYKLFMPSYESIIGFGNFLYYFVYKFDKMEMKYASIE